MADTKYIGQNYTPPDLVAKVTGRARYAEDFRAEGMLFAKLLLSPMPHARVLRIDASAALAMPGVKAILGNTKSIFQLKRLARWAAMTTSEMDSMGRRVDMYGDWVLINIGDRQDGFQEVFRIGPQRRLVNRRVTFRHCYKHVTVLE